MAKRVPFKHKRLEAPEWVFSWRRLKESPLPRWFSLLLVSLAFAFILTSVRVQITAPSSWAARKASVIHALNDAEGRALSLRARESGPFPSRFEPSKWQGMNRLERMMWQAAQPQTAPYVPQLRGLPENRLLPVRLSAGGELTLPKRTPVIFEFAVEKKLTLAPVLYPLSGITADAMPTELPAFDGRVDAALTAELSRFLIQLDATGRVRDCVSLAGGNEAEAGPNPLETWLSKVCFPVDSSRATRWLAVGVGWINQPTDGTHAD